MVKTKVVKKQKHEQKTSYVFPDKKKKIKENLTEIKANSDYRPKGDWWDDILSGETCRTENMDKLFAAIGRAKDQRKSLNIQVQPEKSDVFAAYITLLVTEEDTIAPSKKGKRK